MKYNVDDIVKSIVRRQDEILDNLDQESIDVYVFLRKEARKGHIKNDRVFQFVFRSYYRLDSAGLGAKLKEMFFRLLDEKQQDLQHILQVLSQVPTSRGRCTVQFSFATKLLHTLDANNPIYDSKVARITHLYVGGNTREQRIQSCLEIYKQLKQIHALLRASPKIKNVAFKFRKKFKAPPHLVPDVKVLDFLLWSTGDLEN